MEQVVIPPQVLTFLIATILPMPRYSPASQPQTPTVPGAVRHVQSGTRRSSYTGGRPSSVGYEGFSPWVNIICVSLGTLYAMMNVPDNSEADGALVSCGMGMGLGMAVGPALAALLNPRDVLRTENIVGFMPFYWLIMDLVTGAYPMIGVSSAVVSKTFLAIGVYLIAYWVGTMAKPWRLPEAFLRSCQLKPETSVLMPVVLVCFFLAMLKFALPCKFDLVLMFKSALGARWTAPWGRGQFGGWDAFTDHLAYFGYLLPTFAVMIAQRKSWFHASTLVALLCAAIFLLFLSQSGARRIVGVCLGAAVFTWIVNQRQVRAWHLGILAMGVGAILVLMQMMIISRGLGFGTLGFDTAGSAAVSTLKGDAVAAGGPKTISVDDNFLRLAQTIMLIPERYDYVYYKQIYYTIARPVPRVLWPGKPESPGFDLYVLVASGASLSTTIVGEFWISLGFPAVWLGGWCYGRLARMSSPLFHAASGTVGPMFYGYITMTLFVGFRSLVEVILFSYALLAWVGATWIIKKWGR